MPLFDFSDQAKIISGVNPATNLPISKTPLTGSYIQTAAAITPQQAASIKAAIAPFVGTGDTTTPSGQLVTPATPAAAASHISTYLIVESVLTIAFILFIWHLKK